MQSVRGIKIRWSNQYIISGFGNAEDSGMSRSQRTTPIKGRFVNKIAIGMSNARISAYIHCPREIKSPIPTPRRRGNPIMNSFMNEKFSVNISSNRENKDARIVFSR
jgi:hypothetical protein